MWASWVSSPYCFPSSIWSETTLVVSKPNSKYFPKLPIQELFKKTESCNLSLKISFLWHWGGGEGKKMSF